jgi:hypothetical protein
MQWKRSHIFEEGQYVLEHPFNFTFKLLKWQNQIKESGPTRCVDKNKRCSNNHLDFEHANGRLIHHSSTTQTKSS